MFFTSGLPACAAEAPARPRITGVAYYSVFVSHLEKVRIFYQEFLGYEEAFHLTKPDGSVRKAVLKVNDRQFIVLVNEPNRGEGQLDHYALETSSAEQMRTYLASRGVKVPERSGRDEFGNEMIEVTDPDGHRVRFVEYLPDSRTSADTGKHLSQQLPRVGG
jgi:lactoylglutathione lyase